MIGTRLAAAIVIAVAWIYPAAASDNPQLDQEILAIQNQWAKVYFARASDSAKEAAMARLAKTAGGVSARYRGYSEPLIWEAIVLSSQAKFNGGFGALGLVKRAKALLERGEKINPAVLDGSLYTTLGSLYHTVPGWPIGFGDDTKARYYLKRGLQTAPKDIDANYFYGDFLLAVGERRAAKKYLMRALHAPERPGRPVADKGRRAEIRAALKKARR